MAKILTHPRRGEGTTRHDIRRLARQIEVDRRIAIKALSDLGEILKRIPSPTADISDRIADALRRLQDLPEAASADELNRRLQDVQYELATLRGDISTYVSAAAVHSQDKH